MQLGGDNTEMLFGGEFIFIREEGEDGKDKPLNSLQEILEWP